MSNSNERALSTQLADREVSNSMWHALTNSVFPGAKQQSVLLAIDYCRANKLDPMKKPCHIVPMKVNGRMQDVILPGIYQQRTTAQRTGEYMGHEDPAYGPMIEHMGVKAPEWCKFVVYRWHGPSKSKCPYPVTVYFSEAVGTRWKDGKEIVNSRWTKAPRQMLTKCAEAAALREAFPDALGGEMIYEEADTMSGEYTPPPSQGVTLDEMAAKSTDAHEPEDDIIEGEVVEGDPNTTLPSFTADEIRGMIEEAKSKDQLDEAADLIKHLPQDQRRELREAAVARYPEFIG